MGKIQNQRRRRRSTIDVNIDVNIDVDVNDVDHECDPDAAICSNAKCCSLSSVNNDKWKECDLITEEEEVTVKATNEYEKEHGHEHKHEHEHEHVRINENTANVNVKGNAYHDDHDINDNDYDDDDVKELLIIGAGPHALTLVLRLLEPEPDFLSEKERHRIAESKTHMRSIHQVYRHVRALSRTKAKTKVKTKVKKPNTDMKIKRKDDRRRNVNVIHDDDINNDTTYKKKKKNTNSKNGGNIAPPPLTLNDILHSVKIVDANGHNGRWLSNWKSNFHTLQIHNLRSLMNAHADPYDHRSLEYYAEVHKRGDELVTLHDLDQRDMQFKGPYQVPSTKLFHDFHDALIKSYGIGGIVSCGKVLSIRPRPVQKNESGNDDGDGDDEPIFEVTIRNENNDNNNGVTIVKTKRVVCAMGPAFSRRKEGMGDSDHYTNANANANIDEEAPWETSLRKDYGTSYPSERIIHADEIVPWLKRREEEEEEITNSNDNDDDSGTNSSTSSSTIDMDAAAAAATIPPIKRLLIVGGGITSAQLTLRAVNSPKLNFQSVTFIQRSKILQRHFDVENCWMGPNRGKLLDHFFSLDVPSRAERLREARRGGSIPPEILTQLREREQRQAQGKGQRRGRGPMLECKEEVQIENVDWDVDTQEFVVSFDDGSVGEYDMIWLATGSRNHIDRYPALDLLRQTLPISIFNGLPVLAPDLSWSSTLTSLSSSEFNNQDAELHEPKWKQVARKRIWCMGALSALELGPDALNIIGARHGAVKVASAIRNDIHTNNMLMSGAKRRQ